MTEHTRRLLPDSDAVLGIVRQNGDCDAEIFLKQVDTKYQARFKRWFEYLRDKKPIKNPENLRHLRNFPGGAVWELKGGGYRLYVVSHQGTWYAAHGVKKLSDKRVNAQIDKAIAAFTTVILN